MHYQVPTPIDATIKLSITFTSNSSINQIILNPTSSTMNSPTVKIISHCFIKPRFMLEESKNPIYFSPWDLIMISTNYIQKGLLFRLPENQDFSVTNLIEDLKDSLSITLSHFHPLADRLSTAKQKNPSSFTVFINPTNSPGARFIHSAVSLTVDDILTPIDVPVIVQSFFDHHKAINYDGHEQSLLSIQVTELIDGIFISCSANHMLVDGTSYWHFFNSWSQVFNSNEKYGKLISISRPPVFKRWIPAGSDPILTLPFTEPDQLISRPNAPLLRERIFKFSSDSLSKLKSKVNSECNSTKISTLQSLTAVVWRCITRTRRFPAGQEINCRMAVNNRNRLSPKLPENYFGNSIQSVKVTTRVGELLNHDVGWAALRLHEAVVNFGDKEIREYVDTWMKKPFVYKMDEYFDGYGIHIGSSPRFDMYGNEFGFGKAMAVLSGYGNKSDGKVTVYEGRDGGGSMDLEVCLVPESMEGFECDEEFMSVVNGEIGI